MHDLTRRAAIHLYQEGRIDEARQVLLECIRKDPQDVPSWMWLVATIDDTDERLAALRLCLKANPDNPEVKQALVMLAAQKNSTEAQSVSPLPDTMQFGERQDVQQDEDEIFLSDGWIREMPEVPAQEPGISEADEENPVSLQENPSEGFLDHAAEPGPELSPGETQQMETSSAPRGSDLVAQQPVHAEQAGLPKKARKKSIFGFVFKVLAILVMLAILFSLVFIAWWVGTGHTTRDLVATLVPGAVSQAEAFPTVELTQAPILKPTFPPTYTPEPTPAPSPTPASTTDPSLVMVIRDGLPSGSQVPVAAVSSNNLLVYQAGSNALKVISLDTFAAIYEADFPARLLGLTFSQDGKHLAGIDENGLLIILDTADWQEAGTAQLLTDTGAVLVGQMAFTTDGYGLLVGYCPALDGVCTGTSAVVMHNIPGAKQRYSLAGVNRFASGSGDLMAVWQEGKAQNLLRLVSQFSGGTIRYLQLPAAAQQENLSMAAISAGSSQVAAATVLGSVTVWDGLTGKLLAAWQSGVRDASQVIFGSGNFQVLVGNSRSVAQVWDYETQQLVSDFNLNADYGTFHLDSDGAFRSVRAVTPVIEVWDVVGLQLLESFSSGDQKVVSAAALLQNRQILTISNTGEISLWSSGQLR